MLRTPTVDAGLVDDYTAQVNLKLGVPLFLRFLAVDFMKVLPKHVVESGVDINIHDNIVAGGPYRPADASVGDHWRHVRNPDYFKKSRPYFDEITGYTITDPGTAIGLFRTGQLDYTTPLAPISLEAIVEAERDLAQDWKIHWQPMNLGVFWLFNSEKEPWSDTRVQGALRLATDQHEIWQAFGLGAYSVRAAFPPGSWYGHTHEELLPLPGYGGIPGSPRTKQQDIDDAVALLAEAGFDPPSTLADHPNCCELLVTNVLGIVDLGQLWAAQMERNLGLTLDIKTIDVGSLIKANTPGDNQISAMGDGFNIADPDGYVVNVYATTSRNWSRWRNDEFLELLDQQSKTFYVEERKGILGEMELMLLEPGGNPYIPVQWTPSWNFVHNKVRTEAGEFVPANTIQTVHKQEHLWFEE